MQFEDIMEGTEALHGFEKGGNAEDTLGGWILFGLVVLAVIAAASRHFHDS